jgi:hypothetical protein
MQPYHPHLADPAHGDILLVVNETSSFYVHRTLISLWSPVFFTMLSNGMKESVLRVVHLQEDAPHAQYFGQLLTRLYYPHQRDVATTNTTNVNAFLHFIDKYDLPDTLKDECEACLLRQPRTWQLLVVAERFQLNRLLARQVAWASANLHQQHNQTKGSSHSGRNGGCGNEDNNVMGAADAMAELDKTTVVRILQYSAQRMRFMKNLLHKMTLASNCHLCQAQALGKNLYCSHHVQFTTLQRMLEDF